MVSAFMRHTFSFLVKCTDYKASSILNDILKLKHLRRKETQLIFITSVENVMLNVKVNLEFIYLFYSCPLSVVMQTGPCAVPNEDKDE